MSCMEHICCRCEWVDLDNTCGPNVCPKCGSRVVSYSDEDHQGWSDHHDENQDDAEEVEA